MERKAASSRRGVAITTAARGSNSYLLAFNPYIAFRYFEKRPAKHPICYKHCSYALGTRRLSPVVVSASLSRAVRPRLSNWRRSRAASTGNSKSAARVSGRAGHGCKRLESPQICSRVRPALAPAGPAASRPGEQTRTAQSKRTDWPGDPRPPSPEPEPNSASNNPKPSPALETQTRHPTHPEAPRRAQGSEPKAASPRQQRAQGSELKAASPRQKRRAPRSDGLSSSPRKRPRTVHNPVDGPGTTRSVPACALCMTCSGDFVQWIGPENWS